MEILRGIWLKAVRQSAVTAVLVFATFLTMALPATAREPESIERLRPTQDPMAAARIESWRACLDETYRTRFNFAWCIARVDGLPRWECIAHSSIGEPEDLTEESYAKVQKVLALAIPEERRHYETLCVNRRNVVNGEDCWPRDQDTEFKILEALTEALPDSEATGTVVLFTDLPPCASCRGVMRQFLDRHPNIRLKILYK